jgi:hypothetical protein
LKEPKQNNFLENQIKNRTPSFCGGVLCAFLSAAIPAESDEGLFRRVPFEIIFPKHLIKFTEEVLLKKEF